jgi:uncharacterized protein
VSQLADRFVKDPRDVVKAGQIVSVTVLEVDIPRKRIALTMRKAERPSPRPAQARDAKAAGQPANRGPRPGGGRPQPQERQDRQDRRPQAPAPSSTGATAMSAAFQKLLGK